MALWRVWCVIEYETKLMPMNHLKQRLVGAKRLRTALKDGAVAAFDAERRNLDEGIRPSLEDDADHADGAALAHEREALVKLATQEHAPDRVRQADKAVDARADVCELMLVKAQALDDRGRHAVLLGRDEVLDVCGEDRLAVGEKCVFDEGKRSVALLRRRGGHRRALELHPRGDVSDLGHAC